MTDRWRIWAAVGERYKPPNKRDLDLEDTPNNGEVSFQSSEKMAVSHGLLLTGALVILGE